ncbi:MAG: hypothetical protein ACFFFG_01915 [Candidatus Thorarchaeota archaeon]
MHGSVGRLYAAGITNYRQNGAYRALYIAYETVIHFIPELSVFYQGIKTGRHGLLAMAAPCRKLVSL